MYRIFKLNESEEDDKEEILDDIQDAEDSKEDLQDTIDSEENQDENPVEESSILDKQLDELRDVLVDLDLNLYRIASKENPNNVIYIIGKVSDNSDDVLMLIDNDFGKEDLKVENPIAKDINKEDSTDEKEDDTDEKEDLETRFNFVTLPKSFDEINKLNPRYGEDLTPDHEAIMDYLMNCLIEINPEAAEELQRDKEENSEDITDENSIETPIDIDADEELGEEGLEDED